MLQTLWSPEAWVQVRVEFNKALALLRRVLDDLYRQHGGSSMSAHVKCLQFAIAFLALVGVFIAPVALAQIVLNTINPVSVATSNGRHLVVTGSIACTSGEKAYLRVTVTQRTTGAVAEGRSRVTCTGETQQWEVHAATQGEETFEARPASAVAVALGRSNRGDITDAQQWLVEINLVGE